MFAQFVNVLYSIVDRIYIGNIPQIGDVSLGRRRHLRARHHAAFFFCNTDRYRRLRPVFDASRSKGSGKSKKSPWYKLFHAARFFRCAYHFVSIAESSASSMVRRKQNNISLRQYLHDDLYTRHVLRPAVHGHELFHHRAGISGAWDGNNLDRCRLSTLYWIPYLSFCCI